MVLQNIAVKIYYKNKNSTSFLYISLKSRKTYTANFNGSPPLGRVFKIRQISHAILCQINGIPRASLTPLGRVFKIHDFFRHDFIGCLLSVSGMLLWVTPLGRVFKIHEFFMHGFDKKLIS